MTSKKNNPPQHEALTKLAEAAQTARLTTEQETEAASLLKTAILSGKTGIAAAAGSVASLPWIAGVSAISEIWPDLKALPRKQLLTGLAALQNEPGRRFRLSLGRGLLAHDAPTALKLINTVCAEMISAENGGPSSRDRQIFSNVLIGKGRPWLLHLPLADFKGDEAGPVVHCTIATCFPGQCPPLTQLSVIRWVAAAGKLDSLPSGLLDSVVVAVKRWNPKLRADLQTAVPNPPAPIQEALRTPAPQVEKLPPSGEKIGPAPQPAKISRPPEAQRTPRMAPSGFDLATALRQIESHVNSLRSELSLAKTALRQPPRDSARGRDRRMEAAAPATPSGPEFETLQRHNRQLEETIANLRQQLEELASDHEDIATSRQAHGDAPVTDEKEQFKALLGIKLRANYTEFETLAKEPPDEVFREHYRLLLEDVFQILEKQGVQFKE